MEAERGQMGREEHHGGSCGMLAGFLVCLQAPNQASLLLSMPMSLADGWGGDSTGPSTHPCHPPIHDSLLSPSLTNSLMMG